MLKYSLYIIKTTRFRTNLYAMNQNGIQTNTNKFDGIAFRSTAHAQQGFRKLILNLTESESHLQV